MIKYATEERLKSQTAQLQLEMMAGFQTDHEFTTVVHALSSHHIRESCFGARSLRCLPTMQAKNCRLKSGEIELTMQEITECVQGVAPQVLRNGQVFEFCMPFSKEACQGLGPMFKE